MQDHTMKGTVVMIETVFFLCICVVTAGIAIRYFYRRAVEAMVVVPIANGIAEHDLSQTRYLEERKNKICNALLLAIDDCLTNYSLTLKEEHMVMIGSVCHENGVETKMEKDECTNRRGGSIHADGEFQKVSDDVEMGNAHQSNSYLDEKAANNAKQEDMLSTTYTHVSLPLPGVGTESNTRIAPIFYSICLDEFEVGGRICWSSNSECTHIFHKDCILQWLVRSNRTMWDKLTENATVRMWLESYQLACPCCRQDFIYRNVLFVDIALNEGGKVDM